MSISKNSLKVKKNQNILKISLNLKNDNLTNSGIFQVLKFNIFLTKLKLFNEKSNSFYRIRIQLY